MFQVKLYNTLSDSNVIDKILTNETIFNGTSRQPINILTPEIIIEGQNINSFNYAQIPDLQRYYFITDIILLKSNIFNLNLRVDVLMTYRQDIKDSYGNFTMQFSHNPYFGEYEIESRRDVERYNFDNPFDKNGTLILIALKG